MERAYTSLHNHSEYSNLKLIDSINQIESLIQTAYDIGLKGIAITDHDCVSGHMKALQYYDKNFTDEQKQQFKLILGNEIYLCRSGLNADNHQKGEKFYHLILLAKDKIGHDQIREISSRAWSRSYYKNVMRTPTYSEDLYDIIESNPGHVICSTACLGSYAANQFQQGNFENIDNHLSRMRDLFGKDNFYLEIQPSFSTDQLSYNSFLVNKYWNSYNFICTTDSHYLTAKQKEAHKIFLNSKDGDREVDAFYSSAHLMTYEELQNYFVNTPIDNDKLKTMCDNTNKISNQVIPYTLKSPQVVPKIEYSVTEEIKNSAIDFIETSKNLITDVNYFEKMNNTDSDIYLLYLIQQGIKNKLSALSESKTLEYFIRLNYELEQIYEVSVQIKQSLSDYFITMVKNIDLMWEEGDSLVGPARGSATGFLINYLIGITQINPMEQPIEMPPWRFLHKSRPGLPD